MPQIAGETSALLADLQARLQRLVEVARQEGRTEALGHLRSVLGSDVPVPFRRGPGRPKGSKNKPKDGAVAPKPRKRRKNSWSGLTPEAKLARINAIRKGRGLPLKDTL
jgi:hypothetical protein